MSQDRYFAIYLNDHLAGAVAGTELAHRLAAAEPDIPMLRTVADEISADQQALRNIMARLNVPVRSYKTWAAWAMEKVARLKPNAHLTSRSPLSRVLELEMLRLGVEGKAAGWRSLRARAHHDDRLDPGRVDELLKRAEQQRDQLEELRIQAAADAFGGHPE
ncbi:hypothetical protein [Actinocrispum sp. NPDC049592]|uniref:hypothetical protein n=1 Tax=Actinocrispum sp. NPDC049592 TaxID=3154835 RepID=UPI003421DB75